MLEKETLQRWIQSQHLDEGNLASYRDAFDAHPARMILLQDFLLEEIAMRLYSFLSSEVEYKTRYGLYSKDDVNNRATEQEWHAAEENDRFYKYGRIAETRPEHRLSINLITFMQFRSAWSDAAFAGFFQGATGMRLSPSPLDNAHSYKQGDFLLIHDDELDNRQIAVVLYLSHGWRPEYGGALEIIDRDGTVTRVEPQFNSLLLFDVRAESKHRILLIESPAGERARLTMGGWLDEAKDDEPSRGEALQQQG